MARLSNKRYSVGNTRQRHVCRALSDALSKRVGGPGCAGYVEDAFSLDGQKAVVDDGNGVLPEGLR